MALLRHRRATSVVPVPERDSVLPRRGVVRLVVQRAVRTLPGAVPAKRASVPTQEKAVQAQTA